MEEILDHVDEDTREVHMVGGHHPDWPFEKYVEIVSTIHQQHPHVQIKAFTAAEIEVFQEALEGGPRGVPGQA